MVGWICWWAYAQAVKGVSKRDGLIYGYTEIHWVYVI